MAPSGPNGDDDDDSHPPPPPPPPNDDDDDDDDDDDESVAPTFSFPGKNPDSTPVTFTLALESASFAPEVISLSLSNFKVIKLRQIIEATGPNGSPRLRNRWRPDTIVPEVICPLLRDWLIRCTWIPKESVPPLIESVKNALRRNTECITDTYFEHLIEDGEPDRFATTTLFREHLLEPENCLRGRVSVSIGLNGDALRLVVDFLNSHPPPSNVTSRHSPIASPRTPTANRATPSGIDPPTTAPPSSPNRSPTSRTPGTNAASPTSARPTPDSDSLGSSAPTPSDADSSGTPLSEYVTANGSVDTTPSNIAILHPNGGQPVSIMQRPRFSTAPLTSARFPNVSLPPEGSSPPSGRNDPAWDSSNRNNFAYSRSSGPSVIQELRSDNAVLEGRHWYSFSFDPYLAAIPMRPDGSFPPWTGHHPLHPDHVTHHPVKLPPYLQDKEFFLSHFTPNVFANQHLLDSLKNCRETIPQWDGDRETLQFYVLQLVQHMAGFKFYLPPPHTVTTLELKGSWWKEVDQIYALSEETLSNHIQRCLTSKSAGLVNDATLKSLFLGVSDGFQCFAALLRFIGTPSLSEFPSPLYTTIHQGENTKLSTYINRLVAHTVLMSQSGIMYSERYFFHLLLDGLYVKTPTTPSVAHPQGVALAVSIRQLIDRQDINRPLGSEYSLSNLLTLINSRLFDIGFSSYLTTTPRDALIRQNLLPKPLRPPMVPTPTSSYVPRPPGNALSPRPSNFAAQPSKQGKAMVPTPTPTLTPTTAPTTSSSLHSKTVKLHSKTRPTPTVRIFGKPAICTPRYKW
jgi:hypothetical protein